MPLFEIQERRPASYLLDIEKTIIKWAMDRKEWKIETNFFKLDQDEMFYIPARIDKHNPYSIDDAARSRISICWFRNI